MFKNKRLLLIAMLACIISSLGAQTHSPYSRYGYGILRDQATGISKGMGGAAYGLRNNLSANMANPASYSHVDSMTFIFDVSVSWNRSTLKDGSGSRSDDNGGLDYVTMLFPISKRLGLSAGIVPFSSVGYDFGALRNQGDLSYIESYDGSGGYSQAYVGLGYKLPMTGLSVGANASYLFGKIRHTRSIPVIGVVNSNLSDESSSMRMSTLKLDIGLQYETQINADNTLVLGAVYSPKMNSKGNYNSILRLYTSGEMRYSDTIRVDNADVGLPHSLGVGAALYNKNNWTVAADITFQKWSDVKYSNLLGDELTDKNRFNDRWRYNVGTEFVADPMSRNFIKRIRVRGGASYSNSYMNVKNNEGVDGYNEYGATIGFGLPIRDAHSFGSRTSYININFEYKKIKPKISTMISENYYGISLSASLNELWFYKKAIH